MSALDPGLGAAPNITLHATRGKAPRAHELLR